MKCPKCGSEVSRVPLTTVVNCYRCGWQGYDRELTDDERAMGVEGLERFL